MKEKWCYWWSAGHKVALPVIKWWTISSPTGDQLGESGVTGDQLGEKWRHRGSAKRKVSPLVTSWTKIGSITSDQLGEKWRHKWSPVWQVTLLLQQNWRSSHLDLFWWSAEDPVINRWKRWRHWGSAGVQMAPRMVSLETGGASGCQQGRRQWKTRRRTGKIRHLRPQCTAGSAHRTTSEQLIEKITGQEKNYE